MSAAALLAEARSRGLTLTVEGQKVIYTGPREAVASGLIDRLREHKAELLKLLSGEAEKNGRVLANFGKGYRHPDGRVETGQPEPTPPPAVGWPADLNNMLRRVSTAFEWLPSDRADFIAWARRSPEGMADARAFLETECAKLPAPGLDARRRVVQDMLRADSSLRVAWTCADDDGDPVVITLAIRDAGTCELGIPRAKFDAFALPGLMADLAAKQEGTA